MPEQPNHPTSPPAAGTLGRVLAAAALAEATSHRLPVIDAVGDGAAHLAGSGDTDAALLLLGLAADPDTAAAALAALTGPHQPDPGPRPAVPATQPAPPAGGLR